MYSVNWLFSTHLPFEVHMITPPNITLSEKHLRLARIFNRKADHIFQAPQNTHYRARITLRTGKDGSLGYYKPRSHIHIPINEDDLAHEIINERLSKLGPAPVSLHSVSLRTDKKKVVMAIQERQKRDKNQILEWASPHVEGIALNGAVIWGSGELEIPSGGLTHLVSPGSFYQVNLDMNEQLVKRALELLTPLKPEHILDLYSGYGNLSFPFAQMGIPIELIESNPSSLKDARINMKRFGFSAKLTQQNAHHFQAGQSIFDVALLDPPRTGAGKTLSEIALTRPKAILYISCNPHSFFKEMKSLSGYTLKNWELFDMFPNTPHIESLALFVRNS